MKRKIQKEGLCTILQKVNSSNVHVDIHKYQDSFAGIYLGQEFN